MLAFLGAIVRIVFGFVAACLAAGIVQVLFAVTPAELVAAGNERWTAAFSWALLSAAHIAVFAAPFAFISIVISEWQGIRSFAYHAIVAMGIAVAGFGLIMVTEGQTEATIVNSYAMAAYLTSGFVSGLVYWLFSGRRAMRAEEDDSMLLDGDFEPVRPRDREPSRTQPSRPEPARPEAPRPAAPVRPAGTVPVTGSSAAPAVVPPLSAKPAIAPGPVPAQTTPQPARVGPAPNATPAPQRPMPQRPLAQARPPAPGTTAANDAQKAGPAAPDRPGTKTS